MQILRVLRASRIIARYDDEIGISFVHLKIITYSCLLVVSVHWCACLYRLVVLLEDSPENWIQTYFGTMDVEPMEARLRHYTITMRF